MTPRYVLYLSIQPSPLNKTSPLYKHVSLCSVSFMRWHLRLYCLRFGTFGYFDYWFPFTSPCCLFFTLHHRKNHIFSILAPVMGTLGAKSLMINVAFPFLFLLLHAQSNHYFISSSPSQPQPPPSSVSLTLLLLHRHTSILLQCSPSHFPPVSHCCHDILVKPR